MWESYRGISQRYPKVSQAEERRLLSAAKKGSKRDKDEIILRHVGFLIFRIHKVVFHHLIHRFGEDLLAEAILIAYKKIDSYDLDYRDKQGNPHPVKFVSYIWKRIDGYIIDFLKKELALANFYNRYDRVDFYARDPRGTVKNPIYSESDNEL